MIENEKDMKIKKKPNKKESGNQHVLHFLLSCLNLKNNFFSLRNLSLLLTAGMLLPYWKLVIEFLTVNSWKIQ